MDEADLSKVDLFREYLSEIKSYAKIKRGYGAGQLRLNKSIEFGENIFSLAFCCEVTDSILAQNFDILTGKVRENSLENKPHISINGDDSLDE